MARSWGHRRKLDGAPTAYTYQWYRCNSSGASCAAIRGNLSSYAVSGSADAGSTLAVAVTASNSAGSKVVQSSASAVVAAGTSPFNLNSTLTDGQTISGSVLWQSTPAQGVNFVQFYVDGALKQTITTSPYEYNQSSTGMLDSTLLANGNGFLGYGRCERQSHLRVCECDGYGQRSSAQYGVSGYYGNGRAGSDLRYRRDRGPTVDRVHVSMEPMRYGRRELCGDRGCHQQYVCGCGGGHRFNAQCFGDREQLGGTHHGPSGSDRGCIRHVFDHYDLASEWNSKYAYSTTLAASDGTTPYTWSVASGTLPAGLSLAASTV